MLVNPRFEANLMIKSDMVLAIHFTQPFPLYQRFHAALPIP